MQQTRGDWPGDLSGVVLNGRKAAYRVIGSYSARCGIHDYCHDCHSCISIIPPPTDTADTTDSRHNRHNFTDNIELKWLPIYPSYPYVIPLTRFPSPRSSPPPHSLTHSPTLQVNAILILSPTDGTRILAKYYHPPHATSATQNPYPTPKEQKLFEKGLVEKTAKSNNDIILYDSRIVVFKAESDVMLYVVGGTEENEMLLWHTLLGLRDSLNLLLRYVSALERTGR